MRTTIPFEILSQPIVPGIPDIPYAQQGHFIQISNATNSQNNVFVGYNASPALRASSSDGKIVLTANYIDPNGNVTMIDPNQIVRTRLTPTVSLGAFQTVIFGIQYILRPGSSTELAGATPQEGLAARGFADVISTLAIFPLATVRQVFTNFNPNGSVANLSESAYSVPVAGVSAVTDFQTY